jgi:hypothetical protein
MIMRKIILFTVFSFVSMLSAQYPLKWEFRFGLHFDALFNYKDGLFDKSFLPAGGGNGFIYVEHAKLPLAFRYAWDVNSILSIKEQADEASLTLTENKMLADFRLCQWQREKWWFALYLNTGLVSSSLFMQYQENKDDKPNRNINVISPVYGIRFRLEKTKGTAFVLDVGSFSNWISFGHQYEGKGFWNTPKNSQTGVSFGLAQHTHLDAGWYLGKKQKMGVFVGIHHQYLYYGVKDVKFTKHELIPSVKWAFRILPKQES